MDNAPSPRSQPPIPPSQPDDARNYASQGIIGMMANTLKSGWNHAVTFKAAMRALTSLRVGSGAATLAALDGGDGRIMADGAVSAFIARDRTTNSSYVGLYKDGTIRIFSENGDLVLIDPATGQMTAAAAAGWTALPTLQNGWGAFAGRPPAYRKNLLGKVELRGAIAGGTATAGTLLWTMPAGYVPVMGSKSFPVASNAAYGEIRIDTGGLVNIFAGTNAIISLEGVQYETDA